MTEIIRGIADIVEEAERMKSSYFWTPDQTAHGRRSYEKKHSHPEVQWTDGKDTYTAKYIVNCSCKNIYAYGIYTKNGNKTTLTAIRNSLKRLRGRDEE